MANRLPSANLAQRKGELRCQVRCKSKRCHAMILKNGSFTRCCLCISSASSDFCWHHRVPTKLVSMPTIERRTCPDFAKFSIRNRCGASRDNPRRLATLGDGVSMKRSKIHVNGQRVDFNGLFADWAFKAGDFITVYDGHVTDSDPNLIPDSYKSHIQTVGIGITARYRILGYKSDESPRISHGCGAASIVSSTSGTNQQANSKIVIQDDFNKRLPYICKSFSKNGHVTSERRSDVPFVVLVATKDIKRGDEILRSYLVRL